MRAPLRRLALGAALLALLAGRRATAEPETTISVRLEDLATWRTRLECSWQELLLLYTERREAVSAPGSGGAFLLPAEAAVGFRCRGLIGGRVCRTGLLRQLANPLGFLPEAGVYREPAGLELDRAIDPGSRRGGELRLAEGRVRLLAFQQADGFPEAGVLYAGGGQAGVSLCLPGRAGGTGAVELLALLGEPSSRLDFEEWFPAEIPYPGGLLAHGAAQLRVGRAGAEVRLSGAASGGQRVRPGIWGSVSSTVERERWEAHLLAGTCGRDYRAPGGTGIPERRLAAATVRVHPAAGTALELHASRLAGESAQGTPVLSGERSWRYTDKIRFRARTQGLTESGSAASTRRRLIGPGEQLLVEVSAEREAGEQGTEGLSGQGRLHFRRTRRTGTPADSSLLSTELSAGLSTAGPWEAALGLRWRRRGLTSIGLEGEARLNSGGTLGVQFGLALRRPGRRLYCRFGAQGALGTRGESFTDAVSLVLGWEARRPR